MAAVDGTDDGLQKMAAVGAAAGFSLAETVRMSAEQALAAVRENARIRAERINETTSGDMDERAAQARPADPGVAAAERANRRALAAYAEHQPDAPIPPAPNLGTTDPDAVWRAGWRAGREHANASASLRIGAVREESFAEGQRVAERTAQLRIDAARTEGILRGRELAEAAQFDFSTELAEPVPSEYAVAVEAMHAAVRLVQPLGAGGLPETVDKWAEQTARAAIVITNQLYAHLTGFIDAPDAVTEVEPVGFVCEACGDTFPTAGQRAGHEDEIHAASGD
jgi:hypothetical protein